MLKKNYDIRMLKIILIKKCRNVKKSEIFKLCFRIKMPVNIINTKNLENYKNVVKLLKRIKIDQVNILLNNTEDFRF